MANHNEPELYIAEFEDELKKANALLAKATCFQIWQAPNGEPGFTITVECRGKHPETGETDRWSVNNGDHSVYSREYGGFCVESSLPSWRIPEEFVNTRFTRKEALAIAQIIADKFQKAWDDTCARGDWSGFVFALQPALMGEKLWKVFQNEQRRQQQQQQKS